MWRFLHYFCSLKAGSCPPASSGLRQNGNLEEFCRSTHNALEFPRQIMMIIHKEKNQSKTIVDLGHVLRCIIVFLERTCDASQIKTIFWSEREKKPEKPPNNCKSKWQKPQSKSPKNSAISFSCCHSWFCFHLVNSSESSEKSFWNSKTTKKTPKLTPNKKLFSWPFLSRFLALELSL